MVQPEFEFNDPGVLLELQFAAKDSNTIAALRRIRQNLLEKRGLLQPSFDPAKQLEVHGQLGYLMGQILLCDDLILALTLPPVQLTDESNISE
jgi:hypothetical protein